MTMRPFAEVLQAGKFLVTTELNPPKGTHLESLLDHAERLRDLVQAFKLWAVAPGYTNLLCWGCGQSWRT